MKEGLLSSGSGAGVRRRAAGVGRERGGSLYLSHCQTQQTPYGGAISSPNRCAYASRSAGSSPTGGSTTCAGRPSSRAATSGPSASTTSAWCQWRGGGGGGGGAGGTPGGPRGGRRRGPPTPPGRGET